VFFQSKQDSDFISDQSSSGSKDYCGDFVDAWFIVAYANPTAYC
jgi:hypothetical protein